MRNDFLWLVVAGVMLMLFAAATDSRPITFDDQLARVCLVLGATMFGYALSALWRS